MSENSLHLNIIIRTHTKSPRMHILLRSKKRLNVLQPFHTIIHKGHIRGQKTIKRFVTSRQILSLLFGHQEVKMTNSLLGHNSLAWRNRRTQKHTSLKILCLLLSHLLLKDDLKPRLNLKRYIGVDFIL